MIQIAAKIAPYLARLGTSARGIGTAAKVAGRAARAGRWGEVADELKGTRGIYRSLKSDFGGQVKGFAGRMMENDPIWGSLFSMFKTAGATEAGAAGQMERAIAQAAGAGGGGGGGAASAASRGPGFIARGLKGYKKWSPVVTAVAVTGGFAKGFSEEVFGNERAVDTLRFLGGGNTGGYNPVGEYSTPAPVTPLASNLGTTQYSEDTLGATGQLALDTFYTRHGR